MIHELLGCGRAQAMPCSDLETLTGMSRRRIREHVRQERKQGLPICAATRGHRTGYFLAETPEELADYCKSLQRRTAAMDAMRRDLLQILGAWKK